MAASSAFLAENFVTLVTAYLGSGLVLAGVALLSTGTQLSDLQGNGGIIATIASYASGSFWWVLAWITGIVVMRQIQLRTLMLEIFPENLAYTEKK